MSTNKVKFRFSKPMRAATLNTGTEIVDVKDNCAMLTQADAKLFLDNKMGSVEEGVLEAALPVATPEPAAEDKEVLKGLLKKTVDELQKLAIEFELPEDEWKELTKPNLVNYLIEKAFNKPE